MKNLYRLFTASTVFALLLFNSCEPVDVIVEDLTPKLTSGSWTFSSLDGGDNTTTNFYTFLYTDDVITFNSDGTCTNNQLAESGSGTWSMDANQTTLTLNITFPSGDTRNETWSISSITDTQLVYSFEISPNTLDMTYVH